ncbi:hypothetical protein E4V01_20295 [Methylorubrum sp. Q1]|uniref:hypothetical protein n=1 Tax=Methylorubrum sp. Q1 TaxID=2562453 RepID=UPI0010769450|nr:hypothetical protein [Methylorubrum sp. Q1]TFZ56047.1 hypothetical protein E4V01_20295 [Methylorubrum sp. Q1]
MVVLEMDNPSGCEGLMSRSLARGSNQEVAMVERGWRWRLRRRFAERPILTAAQLACFVLWVGVVGLGTYLSFALPYFPPPPGAKCYFTDALIIFIECRDGFPTLWLNIAWWWTWGSFVTVSFLPFSLPVALPALVTLGFALGFARLLYRLRWTS